MATTIKNVDWRECPTAWFSVLENAIKERDHSREREAVRNLERLGVGVVLLSTAGQAKWTGGRGAKP